MFSPKSIALPLAGLCVVCLAASGCSSTSSAADANAPLPTIGLGSDLGSLDQPGVISGAADVRAVGADNIDTVAVIGDSITHGSATRLYERLEGAGLAHVLIDAQDSKRIAVSSHDNPSGVAVADYITGPGAITDGSGDTDDALDTDHGNELWVVALGTNDINQYSSPDQIAAAVNEMLDAVPDGVPVVWVDTYYRDQSDGAALVNSIVADRLDRRGNAVIAPWSAYAGNDGVLRSDGIHPSEQGEDVFAFVVTGTVQAFLDR